MNHEIFFLLLFFTLLDISKLKKFRCANEYEDTVHPLILTKLINQGEILEAQRKAFVQLEDFRDVLSYAGYFQVNKQFDSNMFFWYFPSQSDVQNDPIILWLQGGPGATSLIGLFMENGPFQLLSKYDIRLRMHAWSKRFSMIYMDNPVGTGFSFSKYKGYAENQTIIAKELYAALKQFFKMFPNIAHNDFYLMGESYGCKYVITLAEYIHHINQKRKKKKINLQGLAVGSGFCDPINQMDYGNYLYQVGLIDHNMKEEFSFLERCIIGHIKGKRWEDAFETFDHLINGDLTKQTLYQNLTGLNNYFNYLCESGAHDHLELIANYVNLDDIRRTLHVGILHFNVSTPLVEERLKKDVMKSVANSVPALLDSYKMLFFNGQLDVVVGYDMTETFLYNLNYTHVSEFRNTTRCIWRSGDGVAGYAKTWGNLTQILVRNAGHMVPTDQPIWAFDMITRFIKNKNYCT